MKQGRELSAFSYQLSAKIPHLLSFLQDDGYHLFPAIPHETFFNY
jgi:hypothetical protein